MGCFGCGGPTIRDQWGEWCDSCGGVVRKVGNQEPELFFRHVATVHGAGGRYSIVHSKGADAYAVAWPKKDVMVTCIHCGKETPGEAQARGLAQLDGVKRASYLSRQGSLDVVLATIQPIAQGDSGELPQLSAGTKATEAERKLLGVA